MHNHRNLCSRPAGPRFASDQHRAQPARVKLAEPAELEQFQRSYLDLTGSCVPLEYLQRASVHVVRRGPDMVGGFVINTTSPLRTLARVPHDTACQIQDELSQGPPVREVACVWMVPSLRGSAVSTRMWIGLALRIAVFGRGPVVYGTEADGLRRFYERFGSVLL
jgi:hypothetical protein